MNADAWTTLGVVGAAFTTALFGFLGILLHKVDKSSTPVEFMEQTNQSFRKLQDQLTDHLEWHIQNQQKGLTNANRRQNRRQGL